MKYWYYSKIIDNLINNTSINSGNISLVIKELGNILGKDNLKLYQRYPNKNNNNYSLVICGDKQCYNIGKWMYKNSTIYLERKYSRYLELFNKYNKKSVVPTEM